MLTPEQIRRVERLRRTYGSRRPHCHCAPAHHLAEFAMTTRVQITGNECDIDDIVAALGRLNPPVEPVLTNQRRKLVCANLNAQQINELRSMEFTVEVDMTHDLETPPLATI